MRILCAGCARDTGRLDRTGPGDVTPGNAERLCPHSAGTGATHVGSRLRRQARAMAVEEVRWAYRGRVARVAVTDRAALAP
ncbi:hypothetical protein, partial [Micromonospora sp. 4G55]|uniref:hypothetical protein n=1 Tax=Micromonospora sp. 4G55 TaxID=2806102 RepID=UPI001EE4C211